MRDVLADLARSERPVGVVDAEGRSSARSIGSPRLRVVAGVDDVLHDDVLRDETADGCRRHDRLEGVDLAELSPTASNRARRLVVPVVVIAAICIVGATIGPDVPSWLDAHVVPAVDSVYDWTVLNNDSHWLFTWIFQPISDALEWAVDAVLWVLRELRWPGVLTLVGLIGWRTGGTRAAVAGVLCLAGCGILGFWDDTMVTMALMLVAVVVALAIGFPLGIVAGRNDRAERSLRGVLDTAQVMPAYVYLLPASSSSASGRRRRSSRRSSSPSPPPCA